ncbi:MAG: hypothetical protein F6K26_34860 [Moorea sp. SIO2I5]|nr:hypothetical protein [Moorena sp. SIO2I5]
MQIRGVWEQDLVLLTTPQFWLNRPQHYELELAEATLGDQILKTIKPLASIAANDHEA